MGQALDTASDLGTQVPRPGLWTLHSIAHHHCLWTLLRLRETRCCRCFALGTCSACFILEPGLTLQLLPRNRDFPERTPLCSVRLVSCALGLCEHWTAAGRSVQPECVPLWTMGGESRTAGTLRMAFPSTEWTGSRQDSLQAGATAGPSSQCGLRTPQGASDCDATGSTTDQHW